MRLKKWDDNTAKALISEISLADANCDQFLCISSPWSIVLDTCVVMHGGGMILALTSRIMKIIMLFLQSYFASGLAVAVKS